MRKGLTTSEAGRLGGLAAAEITVANKQKRIDAWNANPKLCKFCEIPIVYLKRINNFCSHSCAANFSNLTRGYVLSENKKYNCLFCLEEFEVNGNVPPKYCSQICMSSFWWKETKEELLSLGIDKSSCNRIGKKYLIELHEGKCQICGLDKWCEQPMPLVLDHIDGDPYNNLLINLRVVCNNCDALSPYYKGRNKGNGRFKRAARYKYEKETVSNIEELKWRLQADIV